MFPLTHIIIMEDTLFMREVYWQIFFKTEIKILCFPSSGDELLQKVNEMKPNIILMDLVLPRENGITLIRKVREMNSEVSIIAVSSLTDENILIDTFKTGASDFIKKPFTSKEILSSIRGVMNHKQPHLQKIAA